jgi:hypothetical protein
MSAAGVPTSLPILFVCYGMKGRPIYLEIQNFVGSLCAGGHGVSVRCVVDRDTGAAIVASILGERSCSCVVSGV